MEDWDASCSILMPAIGDVLPWHWKQYCLNIGDGLDSSAPRMVWPSVRARAADVQTPSATFRHRALTTSPRSPWICIDVDLFYAEGRRAVHDGYGPDAKRLA